MQLHIKTEMIEQLNSEVTKFRSQINSNDLKYQELQFEIEKVRISKTDAQTKISNLERQIEEVSELLLQSNEEVKRLMHENISVKESAVKDLNDSKKAFDRENKAKICQYEAEISSLKVKNFIVQYSFFFPF